MLVDIHNFGGLTINHKIHQTFLLPTFYATYIRSYVYDTIEFIIINYNACKLRKSTQYDKTYKVRMIV